MTLRRMETNREIGLACKADVWYIDSVISRDAKKSFDWTGEGDDVLDERTFYLQNWRHDVVAIVDSGGLPIEEIRYTAYGTPTMHPIADLNHDGIVNATDATVWGQIQGGSSATGVWSNDDLNRDELFPGDMDDDTFFYSRQTFASGSGYGFRAMSGIGNRKGYAGYEWDNCCTTWHVRHRVLDSESGKWTRMDPLGYVDGVSVYEYVSSEPQVMYDPAGTISVANPCSLQSEGAGPAGICRYCGTSRWGHTRCFINRETGELRSFCCICDLNIRREVRSPSSEIISSVIECTVENESVHLNQKCPFPSINNCSERDSMDAEISCLEGKHARCCQGQWPCNPSCNTYIVIIAKKKFLRDQYDALCSIIPEVLAL